MNTPTVGQHYSSETLPSLGTRLDLRAGRWPFLLGVEDLGVEVLAPVIETREEVSTPRPGLP